MSFIFLALVLLLFCFKELKQRKVTVTNNVLVQILNPTLKDNDVPSAKIYANSMFDESIPEIPANPVGAYARLVMV